MLNNELQRLCGEGKVLVNTKVKEAYVLLCLCWSDYTSKHLGNNLKIRKDCCKKLSGLLLKSSSIGIVYDLRGKKSTFNFSYHSIFSYLYSVLYYFSSKTKYILFQRKGDNYLFWEGGKKVRSSCVVISRFVLINFVPWILTEEAGLLVFYSYKNVMEIFLGSVKERS